MKLSHGVLNLFCLLNVLLLVQSMGAPQAMSAPLAQAAAQAQAAAGNTFHISSVGQKSFALQAEFDGTYAMEGNRLHLDVARAVVLMARIPGRPDRTHTLSHLVIGVAQRDNKQWAIRTRSEEKPLGMVLTTGQEISLPPFKLSIPLTEGVALPGHWLVAQISYPVVINDRERSAAAFAHSSWDMFGPAPVVQPEKQEPPSPAAPTGPSKPVAPTPGSSPPAGPVRDGQPPVQSTSGLHPFTCSSVKSRFAIWTDISGTFSVEADHIKVKVAHASFYLREDVNTLSNRTITGIRFHLAYQGAERWLISASSEVNPVTVTLAPGGKGSLQPFEMIVPLPEKIDLPTHWLAAQIDETTILRERESKGNSLAHSKRKLFE